MLGKRSSFTPPTYRKDPCLLSPQVAEDGLLQQLLFVCQGNCLDGLWCFAGTVISVELHKFQHIIYIYICIKYIYIYYMCVTLCIIYIIYVLYVVYYRDLTKSCLSHSFRLSRLWTQHQEVMPKSCLSVFPHCERKRQNNPFQIRTFHFHPFFSSLCFVQ